MERMQATTLRIVCQLTQGMKLSLFVSTPASWQFFKGPQKRDVLHHIIADEEELFASTKPVFLNQVCIFKYVYPNKLLGEEVVQISVGQIVNMYEDDPASPSQAFDIRFFPPRCAKPQTSKRPDTLYQNINASMGT